VTRVLLALALLASAPAPAASAGGFPVKMEVDASRTVGPLAPIWRFFGADEPNYATKPEGAKLLLELGALRPGQVYFRAHNLMTTGDGTPDLKWGSTNLYTETNGRAVYDWTIVDAIIDSYRTRGLHPYLEIGFMPQALSSAAPGTPYRVPWRQDAGGKSPQPGWTYPPADDAKWAEAVYQWTRHNVARYGRAEVERWYFQVWNEPNLDFYWAGRPEDFYRLHDYGIDAVRRALPTARVGGPDVAGSGGEFMAGFLAHVSTGRNYATGATGTPTDFLSFHAKGQPAAVDGHVRMGLSAQLRTAEEAFARIAAFPTLADKPVVIGENDPEGCAACRGAALGYRNDSLYASYTAEAYARLWQLARKRHVRLEGALSWSFTFPGQPWFAGYRQLATNGVDLPVLNTFRLLAKLGPDEVWAASDHEAPLETVIAEGVRGAPDVGVLATRTASGGLAILLWHYHDDDTPGPAAAVRLKLASTGLDRRGRVWRVDPTHANAFSAWRAMGSPAAPSRAQIRQLAAASRLAAETVAVRGGAIDIELPRQGVALIELR
jgi:xylan 1,4-beta-xylosidase